LSSEQAQHHQLRNARSFICEDRASDAQRRSGHPCGWAILRHWDASQDDKSSAVGKSVRASRNFETSVLFGAAAEDLPSSESAASERDVQVTHPDEPPTALAGDDYP
jgi:hypothetical protein